MASNKPQFIRPKHKMGESVMVKQTGALGAIIKIEPSNGSYIYMMENVDGAWYEHEIESWKR